MKQEMMRLDYLQRAKDFTGSSDIDVLIAAAKKIETYANGGSSPLAIGTFKDFADTLRVQHPTRGSMPLRLYDFQMKAAELIENHPFTILLTARMMGLSTTIAAYALWAAAHKPNYRIAIVGNRYATTVDTMDRLRYMLENTTHALPLVTACRQGAVEFNTGSAIVARSTSPFKEDEDWSHVIFQDAAFIPFSKEAELWSSLQPLINNKGCKVTLQSSACTDAGQFHHVWTQRAHNGFVGMDIPWNAHPDRDEEWARFMRAQLGEDEFKSQYENVFRPYGK